MTQPDFSQGNLEQIDPELQEQLTKFISDLASTKFHSKFDIMFQSKLTEVTMLLNGSKEADQLISFLSNLENEYEETETIQNEAIYKLRKNVKAFKELNLQEKLDGIKNEVCAKKEESQNCIKETNKIIEEIVQCINQLEEKSKKDQMKIEILDKVITNILNVA